MARKETNPLIHCEACGESYSATYRRCPFCGNRAAPREEEPGREEGYAADGGAQREERFAARGAETDRGTSSRGGKRLAGSSGADAGRSSTGSRVSSASGTSRSGSYRGSGPVPQGRSSAPRSRAPQPRRSAFLEFWDRVGISPVRVIGFIFTLVIIILVFLLVTKLILPAIGRGSVDTPDNEKPSQSQPAEEPSPSVSPSTKPVVKDPEPSNTIPADQTAVDFDINHDQFTISAKWPNPVKLEVTFFPAGSTGKVTFTSSDPSVIGVTEDGTVWAVGKGNATVTASMPGAEDQTCKVISTVAGGVPPAITAPTPGTSTAPQPSTSAAPAGKLELNRKEFSISDEWPNPFTLKATGASGTVTWTSSNSAVASVDQNGKVSRVGKGNCTITATDSAGNVGTCLVRCS